MPKTEQLGKHIPKKKKINTPKVHLFDVDEGFFHDEITKMIQPAIQYLDAKKRKIRKIEVFFVCEDDGVKHIDLTFFLYQKVPVDFRLDFRAECAIGTHNGIRYSIGVH